MQCAPYSFLVRPFKVIWYLDSDIDECSLNLTPCDKVVEEETKNGDLPVSIIKGECENTEGSYICSCNTGFEHPPKTTETCEGSTIARKYYPIMSNIFVSEYNLLWQFIARCTLYWIHRSPCILYSMIPINNHLSKCVLSPRSCSDIDECATDPTSCDTSNSKCMNLRGDYKCECNWGFKHTSATMKPSEVPNKSCEGKWMDSISSRHILQPFTSIPSFWMEC